LERIIEANSQEEVVERASAESAWVQVQVLPVGGEASVEGQMIIVRDSNGLWPWPVVAKAPADAEGKARLAVPPGRALNFYVEPQHTWQRCRQSVAALEGGEERELVLRLHPTRFLSALVNVTDSSDLPVEGALVSPLGAEDGFPAVTTDLDGVARLTDIREGWSTFFEVRATGFARGYGMVDDGTTTMTVALKEEARLVGRVVTASGAPAAAAQLELRVDPNMHGVYRTRVLLAWHATTDEEGVFSFNGLPPGEGMLLSVEFQGHLSVQVLKPLMVGDQQHDVQLAASPVLTGTVVDPSGKGVGGIEIELEPIHFLNEQAARFGPLRNVERRRVTTDLEGQFVFGIDHGLYPGTWRLGTKGALDRRLRDSDAAGVDLRWLPVIQEVEIQAGDTSRHVLVEVHAGKMISGFILNQDHQPVQQGVVRAFPMDSSVESVRLQTSTFGEDGSFTLGPFPEGSYLLAGGNPAEGLVVEVEGVPAGTQDLVLLCKPVKGVTGRIVDLEGKPQQTRLWAFDRKQTGGTMWSLTVDGGGLFRMAHDSDHAFDFMAFSHRGVAGILSAVDLKYPAEEVLIVVEPAGEVQVDVGNIHSETMYVICFHRGEIVFEGNPWRLEAWRWLPEGPLRLELRDGPRMLAVAEGMVLLGEKLELELRAPDEETAGD
jgi:hypothetical protein